MKSLLKGLIKIMLLIVFSPVLFLCAVLSWVMIVGGYESESDPPFPLKIIERFVTF